jgi:hypothetical protein
MIEYNKTPIIERDELCIKYNLNLLCQNNGRDDRYGRENETDILNDLNEIYKNFIKNDLLLLLENNQIVNPVKIKAIEKYDREFGESPYKYNMFKGLSIDDF